MYEEGDQVELRNVSFRVKMVNNNGGSESYELESEYGCLDFVPPVNVTKREPRVGDVYKVRGKAHLHIVSVVGRTTTYFLTDDLVGPPGTVVEVDDLGLDGAELVLEGP